MDVSLLLVPYDAGHEGIRMGAGPDRLAPAGATVLRDQGIGVRVERLTDDAPFTAEIRTAFALHRQLAGRVRAARESGAFPLVLSGNCNSALGTIAGVDPADLGIIWFDSHLDARTPESTKTGSLDGMGVATALGRCWTTLTATIQGFAPVAPERVLYVGSRHIDPDLTGWVTESGVAMITAAQIQQRGVIAAMVPALAALQARVQRVYLHVDLDVLDPVPAPANELALPDGLTSTQIEEGLRLIGERFAIVAAGIASYDPALDRDDSVRGAGVRIMAALTAAQEARKR